VDATYFQQYYPLFLSLSFRILCISSQSCLLTANTIFITYSPSDQRCRWFDVERISTKPPSDPTSRSVSRRRNVDGRIPVRDYATYVCARDYTARNILPGDVERAERSYYTECIIAFCILLFSFWRFLPNILIVLFYFYSFPCLAWYIDSRGKSFKTDVRLYKQTVLTASAPLPAPFSV
jgi:hypothetical protein